MCPFSCVQACVLSAFMNRGGWKEKLKRSEHTAWFNETAQSLDLPPSPPTALHIFTNIFLTCSFLIIQVNVSLSYSPQELFFGILNILFFLLLSLCLILPNTFVTSLCFHSTPVSSFLLLQLGIELWQHSGVDAEAGVTHSQYYQTWHLCVIVWQDRKQQHKLKLGIVPKHTSL